MEVMKTQPRDSIKPNKCNRRRWNKKQEKVTTRRLSVLTMVAQTAAEAGSNATSKSQSAPGAGKKTCSAPALIN
jgi:hypothetical protein